ncbi:hypothetical protein C5167_038819 [Papaver somniferum]|uniref:Ubiquitin-like domain-containing protein n=1 Tax=Papaver somniferum TaxID=3469 RepID=A0A4Y7IAB7_PAPSO|nr:BAG family molecular chaperone regulator 1-like [Papaver somniferum]RZC45867.1 hypothetical protein C5167_038819 [Papaver somniferum]
MMKKTYSPNSSNGYDSSNSTPKQEEEEAGVEWEMRPGGMLVQKRCSSKSDTQSTLTHLNLRVAYGSMRYEMSIAPQSTFGELKKLLAAETGLQPAEQLLTFKGKDRGNGEFLDRSGVKNKSKIILVEDPSSKERRFIEMRKNAKLQSAHRAISDISMEVEKLVAEVSAIEKSVSNGIKVAEVQITTLTEMLMRQAIKLDSIATEGDTSTHKNLQSKRVQKCVEALDVLKVSNAGVKPAVVKSKWEAMEAAQSRPQWEYFD